MKWWMCRTEKGFLVGCLEYDVGYSGRLVYLDTSWESFGTA